jgi:hypothetical protein
MNEKEYFEICLNYKKELKHKLLQLTIFSFVLLIPYIFWAVSYFKSREDIAIAIKLTAISIPVIGFILYIFLIDKLTKKLRRKYKVSCGKCGHEPDLYSRTEVFKNVCVKCGEVPNRWRTLDLPNYAA